MCTPRTCRRLAALAAGFRAVFVMLAAAAALATSATVSAQQAAADAKGDGSTVTRAGAEAQSAMVLVDGRALFQVVGTTAYPAAQRAQAITERIEALARDPARDPATMHIEETPLASEIKVGDFRVVSVLDDDAALEGLGSRGVLATVWADRIRGAVADYRAARTRDALLRGGGFVALATVALLAAMWAMQRLRRLVRTRFEARLEARLQDLRVQDVPLIHARQVAAALHAAVRALWALAWIALFFVYLEFALSRFVWTRPFAERTIDLVVDPLARMRDGIVGALPGLVFIAVLAVVVYWIVRTGRLFFDAVATGAVKLGGFEAEWAGPTYRILRAVVLLFAAVIAFPYLPGSSSEAFKGISVFVGIMLSLGAASMIGNLLAGYSMIYRRAFRVGDRIKVGEHFGDVTHIRAMVTHLRTPKNEEVVVPNSRLLGEAVVNYSSLARSEGLILHTTVGIGYETPWRQVEAMLVMAAGRTADVKAQPAPFVLQKSLGDFCIVYELNVYVERAQGMNRLYAELHRHILDVFNEYGVQIMTPAYERDPPDAKLVPPAQWYAAPARRPEDAGAPGAG
jgi:small-conductance mechanosensitive channel